MRPDRSTRPALFALTGLAVCGTHFTILYAVATLACLTAQSPAPAFDLRTASIVVTVILSAVLIVFLIRQLRNAPLSQEISENDAQQFLNRGAVSFALLGTIGMMWVTLPVLMIADCRTP